MCVLDLLPLLCLLVLTRGSVQEEVSLDFSAQTAASTTWPRIKCEKRNRCMDGWMNALFLSLLIEDIAKTDPFIVQFPIPCWSPGHSVNNFYFGNIC